MTTIKEIIQQATDSLFSNAPQSETAAPAPVVSTVKMALSQVRNLAAGDIMTIFGTEAAGAFLTFTQDKDLEGIKHSEDVKVLGLGKIFFGIQHYSKDTSPYLHITVGYPMLTSVSLIYFTMLTPGQDSPESDTWSKVMVNGSRAEWKLRDVRESTTEREAILRAAAEGFHKDRLMDIKNEARIILTYFDGTNRSVPLTLPEGERRMNYFFDKVGEYEPLVKPEIDMVRASYRRYVDSETLRVKNVERVTNERRAYFDGPYRTWLQECSAVWTHNNDALIRMQKDFGNKSITIKRLGFMAPGRDEGGPFSELTEQVVVTQHDVSGLGGPLVFTDTAGYYRRPRPGRYGEGAGAKLGFESVTYRYIAYMTEAETLYAIELREYNYNLGVDTPFLPPNPLPMYEDALPEGFVENLPYLSDRRTYHTLVFSRLFWSLDEVQKRMGKELLTYPKCPLIPEQHFTLPAEANQELTLYSLRLFKKVFYNKTDAELDAEEAEGSAKSPRSNRRPVRGNHPNPYHQDNYPDSEGFDDPFAGD